MKENMENIFLQYNISAWSACSFSLFKDKLIQCRAKEKLPQNAKSILCVLFPYLLPDQYYHHRNVSRYAVSKDYHIIAGDILKRISDDLSVLYPNAEFVPFIDNSPLPEVEVAVTCGLGVIGDNGLLITPTFGSWVFIGAIVTNAAIETKNHKIKPCLQCGACRAYCPNQAITAEGINTQQCLSHITQKKDELTKEEQRLIKQTGIYWGCDICQEVCPMNANAKVTPIEAFYEEPRAYVSLEDDISNYAYTWRGKKVIHRNLLLTE